MKYYLLKNFDTGVYRVKSTTKCWDKYVKSQTATISFGGDDKYFVMQEVTVD